MKLNKKIKYEKQKNNISTALSPGIMTAYDPKIHKTGNWS